jgi:hypothetical protein
MDNTDTFFEGLIRESGTLKDMEEVEVSGVDAFLLPDKIKVASLGDLSEFFRIATDTLVHKAQKDLWRISEDAKGNVVIERLFNPKTAKPIKV